MSVPQRAELLLALRVATVLVGLVGVTALAVRVLLATQVRELLGFTFAGLPRNLGAAAEIFSNNLRVLAAILAACVVVRVAHQPASAIWERLLVRAVARWCDAALLAGSAINVLFIGSAFGAYGGRSVGTVLAHAPFELAAFSLVLALYIVARREQLAIGRLARGAMFATAALAVGALLEVFA